MIVKKTNKDKDFYEIMGKYFASRDFIKELDCQLYDNNFEWYLFFENNILKGFTSIENKKTYYYLDNFYVFENYRNNKIGEEIIKEIISKYNCIKLISRNKYAIKIFKKYCFKEYGKNGRYVKMCYKAGE